MHDPESFLPQARAERLEAHLAGTAEGARYIEELRDFPYSTDPNLQYEYCIGLSQAIANHGRDVAGIGGKHSLDPQKKGNKA